MLLKISENNIYCKISQVAHLLMHYICFGLESKTECENSSKHVLRKKHCIHKQKKQKLVPDFQMVHFTYSYVHSDYWVKRWQTCFLIISTCSLHHLNTSHVKLRIGYCGKTNIKLSFLSEEMFAVILRFVWTFKNTYVD